VIAAAARLVGGGSFDGRVDGCGRMRLGPGGQPELQSEDPSDGRNELRSRQSTGLHRGQQALLRGGQIRWHQQHVVTGEDGPHRGLTRRPTLSHRRHVQRIGDHHALEAELTPEQTVDHLRRERRRYSGVDRLDIEVADHDHVRTGGDAGPERHEVDSAELSQWLAQHR